MINAFITVRTKSTRLPRKCLLEFGGENVLEHVIRRTKNFGFEPIVCTTEEPEDNVIMRIAREEEVKCFRGSEINKLKRWADCCFKYDIDEFHTIDADDPFFDGELVRKSMEWLDLKRVDAVYPTKNSSVGGASVGFSLRKDILLKALSVVKTEDTEMVWKHLEKVPGFRFAKLRNNHNPPRARLTLDYMEDYVLLYTIKQLVGTFASRKVVDTLLRRNPDLYRVNWFRNEDWKRIQASK